MTDAQLLVHLIELEIALMRNAGSAGAEEAAGLLHPQAEEIGRSGRSYDRAALLRLLADSDPSTRDLSQPSGFALCRLGEGLAQLRYRSEREGAATERSSLWQLHEGSWRLRFHQGTPV